MRSEADHSIAFGTIFLGLATNKSQLSWPSEGSVYVNPLAHGSIQPRGSKKRALNAQKMAEKPGSRVRSKGKNDLFSGPGIDCLPHHSQESSR